MEALFLKLLNMSITASWLVVAVVLLRLVFKRAPRVVSLILWALVGIRLILPISLESVFSLIPSAQTFPSSFATSGTQTISPSITTPAGPSFPSDFITPTAPSIQSGIPIIDSSVNQMLSQSLTPNVGDSVNPIQVITFIATVVWIAGVSAMLLYALISYIRLRLKVREAVKAEGNVMVCDNIASPFILGIIRPRIFIPSSTDTQDIHYVLAHENAHLKRRDHLWKPLGFLLLSVYWFNPVLWVAYILLCRDIELACDEKVIKELGIEAKKPYSTALVNCSVSRKAITVCPLAFGEVGVKRRVKTVLNYKKPAFWIIIIAIIACIAVALCFLTNPTGNDSTTTTTTSPNTTTTTTPDSTTTTRPTPIPEPSEDLPNSINILYKRTQRAQHDILGNVNYTITEYGYNEKGQLISETSTDTAGNPVYEYRYRYDEDGNKIYFAANIENRYFEETTYDKHGNITRYAITSADASTNSTRRYRYEYEYDNAGNLLAESCYSTFADKEFLVHEKEYNKNGKVTLSHHYADTETITQYQYDANGNLTLQLTNYPDGSFNCKYEYEYDKNGNLLSESYYDNPDKPFWKEVYEYDEYGNQTKNIRYDSDGNVKEQLTTVYKYNENGIMESKTVYKADGSVLYEITYSNPFAIIE